MDQNTNEQMPQKSGNGFSIASMVLGITAVFPGCCNYYIGIILSILAVSFGAISLSKKMPGKGMAIAGLVLGIVFLVLNVVFLIVGNAFSAWLLSLVS